MDVLHSITLDGIEALDERQRLLSEGKEVSLLCHRRNAQGMDVSRSLYFGKCAECAWVASLALEDPDDIGIEISFLNQAQQLYAAHIGNIMTAKMLTNSSPLSPERFDLDPDIDSFAKNLHEEFGVKVDPWS